MFTEPTTNRSNRKGRSGRTAVAAVLAGALLLMGCGTADTTQVAAGASGTNSVSSDHAPDDLALVLDSGQDAPTRDLKLRPVDVPIDRALPEVWDFDAVSLDDGSTIGGGVIGAGPSILAFVTPWCPVCQNEAPDIAEAAGKNPDINYVLIHSGGTAAEHRDFVSESGLIAENIINIADGEGTLWQRFSIVSQPSYVLVDSNGLLRSSVGQLEHDGLVRAADLITAGF